MKLKQTNRHKTKKLPEKDQGSSQINITLACAIYVCMYLNTYINVGKCM